MYKQSKGIKFVPIDHMGAWIQIATVLGFYSIIYHLVETGGQTLTLHYFLTILKLSAILCAYMAVLFWIVFDFMFNAFTDFAWDYLGTTSKWDVILKKMRFRIKGKLIYGDYIFKITCLIGTLIFNLKIK